MADGSPTATLREGTQGGTDARMETMRYSGARSCMGGVLALSGVFDFGHVGRVFSKL